MTTISSAEHAPKEAVIRPVLFYSGLVSWKTYIKALIWQRRQRPLIGQIALHWGLLTLPDIRDILAARRLGEKFGESAVRQG